jgi:hypothetical protein
MTSGENFRSGNFRVENSRNDQPEVYRNDQPQFYMWQAPGTVLSIYLSLQVVEELTAEYIRTNAGGLPGDIHGVLLGRSMSEPQATYVEDFVLIPRRGIGKSGVTGSASDDELREMVCRLHRGVDAGRQAIGFFRSQSDGKLMPSRGDLKIADRLFPQPENVMLLIQFSEQGDNEAAFFYRQNGKMGRRECIHTFPFDVAKLSSRRPGGRRKEDNAPLEWPRPARGQAALGTPKAGMRWWQLLPTAALFTLGTIAAQTALDRKAVTPVSPSEITASYEAPLGLKVTSLPHQLQVRWNHDSPAIRAAEKGEIRIAEGDVVVTQVIPIDRQQLLNGYVAYTPLTNDVSISFEVKTPDGRRTTESIRAVAMPGSN